jgi:hypothetical protein
MKRRASESLQSTKLKVPRARASEQQEDTTNAAEQRSSSEPIQHLSTPEATSANGTLNDRQDSDATSAPTTDPSPQTTTKPTFSADDVDVKEPELNGDKLSDVHTNHDDEINDRKVGLVSQMQQDANDLRAALILLIEIRHLRNGTDNAEKIAAREQAHLERVCWLVVEKEMLVNPCTKLPFNCLTGLENLYETQERRRRKQAEHDECVEELEQAMEAFEAAISKRTALVFDESGEDIAPEIAAEIRDLISDAGMQVKKTQQKLYLLQKALHGSEEGERSMSEAPLRMAETVLVEQRGLFGTEDPTIENQDEQPKTTGDPIPNAAPEDGDLEPPKEGSQPEQEHNIGSQQRRDRHVHPRSRTRQDRTLRPRAGGIRKRRTSRSNRGYDRYYDVSKSVHGKRDFVELKREEVMNVRRALSTARKQREDVRRHYYANLVACLQAEAENNREAAQLEFDQNHFLEQQKLTTEEFILEEDNEMFTRQAKELRAFHADEITSDFSDWTGDGYDDSGFDPLCPIWKLDEARITAWVDSERDRLGLNDGRLTSMKDNDWDVEEPAFDPESKTILPFGNGIDPHDEDLLAGKWRRMIDNYQHKQDKLRSQPKLGTLSWWQEVSGI